MRVDLRHDRKVDVVEQMQRLKWDIDAQRAVFVLAAKFPRFDRAVSILGQEDDGIKDAGNGRAGDASAENEAIRRGDVVEQLGRRVSIIWDDFA